MKKSKIILIAVTGVIIVVGVVAFFLVQNLDGIVKAAIEKYGTEAAGTPVRVQTVKLSLREGRGTIDGLTVGNPAGFSSKPIFRLGHVTVAVDTSTLTSDTPVVKVIQVGAPSFRYEVNAKGRTNLGIIRQNVKRFTAAHGGGNEGTGPAGEKGGKHLRVRRLSIQGGEGAIDLNAIGGNTIRAKVPPVTLTDLGGKQGMSPAALGRTVLAALVENLQKAAARQGVKQMIQGKLGGAVDGLRKQLDRNLGPDAGGALKNLLGQ